MNTLRITQTASTIAHLMGFSMPDGADVPNKIVTAAFSGKTAQKALLYNPDAIALWLYQKYTELFAPVIGSSVMALPVRSVMPSVTPVCFASMYSGLVPDVHGIKAYKKPVLTVSTLFDAAIAAGKKPIIVSTDGDSMARIFNERDMDYIFCETLDECNEKALEVIAADKHDIIAIYNGNYDSTMHKTGPESEKALSALTHNVNTFAEFYKKAEEIWKNKNFVAAFLPDHGCHEIDGECGSHGLDMDEDMDIIHFYNFHTAEK